MKNKQEKYVWLILLSISTSFSFALDERQMNLFLVGIMALVPVFLLVQYPSINIKREGTIYLLLLALIASSLFHLATFRIATLVYSAMFLLTFIYYMKLIVSNSLTMDRYLIIIKSLLVAYFVVLLIQQFCLLVGSPYIFNFVAGDTDSFKLNSLSPEPSHTARILMVLMYSFIFIREVELKRKYNLIFDRKRDKYIWLIFLYPMLTMGSGFAIVLLLAFLPKIIKIRKLIIFLPFVVVAFMVVLNLDLPAVERVLSFGRAFFSLDPDAMMNADHSASIRVVPTILYFNMLHPTNVNIWVGYGTDYASNLVPTLMYGINEGSYRGGIFPAFFIDRGLICVALLFYLIRRYCLIKVFSYDTFILLLLIFSTNINTQLFWISIMLYATNKYFKHINEIEFSSSNYIIQE